MSAERIYRVAILAMGGEGGGVLADWLVHMAESAGFEAQTTSVPGVAQRTGATIYYVEFVPADPAGRTPVLSLMPVPGEVDLVVASELMEAGRALQRGLVTSDRTTLISSTHRVYSMTEKTDMADGRVDSNQLLAACHARAAQFVGTDFAALAASKGSVVSASLFGAMAACAVLPFERAQFEKAIESSGIGVRSSLAAFAIGHEAAAGLMARSQSAASSAQVVALSAQEAGAFNERAGEASAPAAQALGPGDLGPRLRSLRDRVLALPSSAHATLAAALIKLCDYQDADYAAAYLQRAEGCWASLAPDEKLFESLMRGLALWMAYEDIARVADLKTRASRFRRVAEEVNLQATQLLEIREYLHPRVEEVADALPQSLGRFVLGSAWARAVLKPLVGDGRVVNTSSLRGYVLMRGLAGLRRWRRGSLRHADERSQWESWLGQALTLAASNPGLAMAVADAQRLIKGYSDTHQRGRRNFQMLMELAPGLATDPQGGALLESLCKAAQADEQGLALQSRLRVLYPGMPDRALFRTSA